MPMSTLVADTPYYVLMEDNCRAGPKVVPLDSRSECLVIYGFSDRAPYDKFCTNSELALKPYPLVKGYLRNQLGASGDDLKLVVLDASGPREPCLHAATMEAVLEAQENPTTRLNAGYRLMLDQETDAYQVEKAPECFIEPNGLQV